MLCSNPHRGTPCALQHPMVGPPPWDTLCSQPSMGHPGPPAPRELPRAPSLPCRTPRASLLNVVQCAAHRPGLLLC